MELCRGFVILEREVLLFETLGTENVVAQRHDPEERTPCPNHRKNLETRIELEERHESITLR
jgi:hypothetical protein